MNVINNNTVEIVSEKPDPLMLNRLSKMGAGIMPSKYIEEVGLEEFLKNPIGTGPYKFSERVIDDHITLVKNEDYYGDQSTWKKVTFRVIPENATRVSELITGGVDVAASIPSSDVERIKGTDGKTIVKGPIQRVLQIIIRHTEGTPTEDPKVREAIDLAINKQGLIDSIAGGAGIPTRTSVTPGNFGSDPSLYEQSLYDLEKAKALLKEAGYSDNGPEISFASSTQYKEYAETVAAMLTEAGFQVKLDVLEPTAFYEKFAAKSFGELFLIGIGNSMNDASNNYGRYLYEQAKGETDYNNPTVEKLLQESLVTVDQNVRENNYKQVQQIFAEERPAVYLFQMEGVYGINDSITFTPRKDELYYVNEIVNKAK